MGAIEDNEMRDVLMRTPRGVHALPLPIGEAGVNIESSALRMPWWADVSDTVFSASEYEWIEEQSKH